MSARLRAELACLALVLVASWPLLGGRCFAGGDILPYALPHLAAAQAELLAGRLRVWDLTLYCGYYAHGAGQAGSLYLPDLALLLALPLLTAFKASTLLHQWLLARGLLAAVVELGGSRRAGLLAAGACLLSGTVGAHVWHHGVVVALGWTGPVLWLAARTARRPGLTAPLLLAAAVALGLQGSHLQWVAYQALAAVTLAPAAAPRGRRLAAGALVVGAFALAAAMGAALLLPVWGHAQVFPRPHIGGSWAFLAGDGLRAADLPGWVLGGHAPDVAEAVRPGAATACLALAGALAAGPRAPLVRAGLALVALGLFVAPGGANPAYHLLVHLPPFSLFRIPARAVVLAQVGLCLLAAGGLDLLLRGRLVGLARPVAAAGVAAVAAAAAARLVVGEPVAPGAVALALAGVAAFAAAARAPAGWRPLGAALVLAAALAELVPAYHAANPTAPDEVLTAPPPLAAPILAADDRRLLDVARDHPDALVAARRLRRNGPTRFGVEYFSGFESAPPLLQEVQMLAMLEAAPDELVDLAGRASVRWLVVDAPLDDPRVRLAGTDAGALLYEHTRARPRCYVLRDDAVEPARLEVLAPTQLRARARLATSGRLVVAHAWYPGWSATSGGRELELELVEDLFMGVDLPAGEHVVELTFEDPELEHGLRLSAAGWLLWALALVLVRRRGAPAAG